MSLDVQQAKMSEWVRKFVDDTSLTHICGYAERHAVVQCPTCEALLGTGNSHVCSDDTAPSPPPEPYEDEELFFCPLGHPKLRNTRACSFCSVANAVCLPTHRYRPAGAAPPTSAPPKAALFAQRRQRSDQLEVSPRKKRPPSKGRVAVQDSESDDGSVSSAPVVGAGVSGRRRLFCNEQVAAEYGAQAISIDDFHDFMDTSLARTNKHIELVARTNNLRPSVGMAYGDKPRRLHVLSLFDGIGSVAVSLKRLGVDFTLTTCEIAEPQRRVC